MKKEFAASLRPVGAPRLMPTWIDLGLAVSTAGAGASLVFLIHEITGRYVSFLPLFLALIIAALYGRLIAGLLAVVFAASSVAAFWMGSPGWFLPHPIDNTTLGLFAFLGVLIVITVNRASEALRRARCELQTITDIMASGVARCSRDMRYRWASRVYLDLLGRPAEEVIGRPIGDVLGEELFAAKRPYVERVLSGEPVTFEQRMQMPHGPQRWIQAAYTPERDGNGRIDGWVEVMTDISDRKATEEALQQSERRLRTMLDAQPECVKLVSPDGRLLDINPAGLKMVEAESLDQVRNRNIYDPITPESLPAFRAMHDAAMTGYPLAHPTEFEIFSMRGKRLLLESRATPLRDESGDIIAVLSVTRDIGERKRIERSLRASEQAFKTITNAAPALVWVCTSTGEAIYVNDRWHEFTGQSPAEASGRGWATARHPDDAARILPQWKRCCLTGEVYEGVVRYRRHDGEYVWHEVRALPRRDADGRIEAWYGVSLDISARKQAEEALRDSEAQLREADRRKDEFLAILAHELRNPLAPIRTSLELMKLAAGDAEGLRYARLTMQRQVDQMVRLVDDLLDVSRISRGIVQLRKSRVQLAAIVRGAIDTSRPALSAAGQTLQIEIPVEPIFVDADEMRLSQVFTNLLNNAAKYTPRGGRIRVTTERIGNDAVVTIEDNGRGIPEYMLTKVFDMFMQADRTLDGPQAGLGVGLSIAKHLVEMHGGSIEARSEGPGMGSRFIVRIPVILSLVGTEPQRADEQLSVPSGHRILVVDDNADAATTMAMMLKAKGNETWTARGGLEALELAAAFRPDVVLLDIGMPGLDGYEVCRRLRKQPWAEGITVVAVTGWGEDASKRASQEAGFDLHLVKPVELSTLEVLLAGLQTQAA